MVMLTPFRAAGVIPASFNNQVAAERLAMCNDIGEAAYVDSLIAAALVEALRKHPHADHAMRKLITRYGFGLLPSMTGALQQSATLPPSSTVSLRRLGPSNHAANN
jgi:hypothetical protein